MPVRKVTLSSTGTPVWLTVPWEATACLPMPAKTWAYCPLTPLVSCHGLFPALPNSSSDAGISWTPPPPKDALAQVPAEATVGRLHFPIVFPPSPSY